MISICGYPHFYQESHLHLFKEIWYPERGAHFPQGVVYSALDLYSAMSVEWINYDTKYHMIKIH